MKPFVIASWLTLISATAFAQGGSPYNSSGSQAGGPLAGQERRMGGGGGTPSVDPAPTTRPATKVKTSRKRKHQSRR